MCQRVEVVQGNSERARSTRQHKFCSIHLWHTVSTEYSEVKWSDVGRCQHKLSPHLPSPLGVSGPYLLVMLWHRARASPDPDHRTDRFHFGTLYHCQANGPCHIVNAVRCAARTYNMEILWFANGFPHGRFNQKLSRNVLMETRTLFPVSIRILQYTEIKPWTMLKKKICIQCAASLLQL